MRARLSALTSTFGLPASADSAAIEEEEGEDDEERVCCACPAEATKVDSFLAHPSDSLEEEEEDEDDVSAE